MVTAHLPCQLLLEGAEIAEQIRPSELVIERCGTDRPFEHDLQRRGDPLGLAVLDFPRLRQRRDLQMRHGEAGETRLRPRADAGRAFVANLAAGTGRRARRRRNGRRMVVRFHLHQDVRRLGVRRVAPVGVRVETARHRALHHGSVVFIGDDRPLRTHRVRVADHGEQRLRLSDAIDDPFRVEDLVPAVLGVRLCEHHQLDVGRIPAGAAEVIGEIVDLVRRQSQAQRHVGPRDGRATAFRHVDRLQRPRCEVLEQPGGVVQRWEHRLGHPVVDVR